MQVSFEKSIRRRKFFWFTLPQKNFILYMKMEFIIFHFFVSFFRRNFLYFKMCTLDMEIHLTMTSIFWSNGKQKESILHWSNWKGAINSPFYKNRDKCCKLGQNPSAKNGLVHFLLGAMLPCSTPFCTSGEGSPFTEVVRNTQNSRLRGPNFPYSGSNSQTPFKFRDQNESPSKLRPKLGHSPT